MKLFPGLQAWTVRFPLCSDLVKMQPPQMLSLPVCCSFIPLVKSAYSHGTTQEETETDETFHITSPKREKSKGKNPVVKADHNRGKDSVFSPSVWANTTRDLLKSCALPSLALFYSVDFPSSFLSHMLLLPCLSNSGCLGNHNYG